MKVIDLGNCGLTFSVWTVPCQIGTGDAKGMQNSQGMQTNLTGDALPPLHPLWLRACATIVSHKLI